MNAWHCTHVTTCVQPRNGFIALPQHSLTNSNRLGTSPCQSMVIKKKLICTLHTQPIKHPSCLNQLPPSHLTSNTAHLATALVLVEKAETCNAVNHIRTFVHHNHGRSPQTTVYSNQRIKVHEDIITDPAQESTAHES